ncbi:MAG: hypothetical protein GY832_41865 [Chloroflexi bacterium]|nr:hypothetical protein [Chloroflexota bacterium]
MAIDVFRTIMGGVVASVVWFIIGGALYMNPLVDKIYKSDDNSAVREWPNLPKYLGLMFAGGALAQYMLWAFVFALVKSALPGGTFLRGVTFGLVLIAVKIFPRFFDMWIQTTYPNKKLVIEFINGSIGSFVGGVIFAYVI